MNVCMCVSMVKRKIFGDRERERERERERGKEIGSCDSDNYERETSNEQRVCLTEKENATVN